MERLARQATQDKQVILDLQALPAILVQRVTQVKVELKVRPVRPEIQVQLVQLEVRAIQATQGPLAPQGTLEAQAQRETLVQLEILDRPGKQAQQILDRRGILEVLELQDPQE